MFMLMPAAGFRYSKGAPKQFTRRDLERAVTREFCAECGTHLITRLPDRPFVVVKVGTLDDPTLFGSPQMAIYTVDKQPFHVIPDGLPAFERLPQSGLSYRIWSRNRRVRGSRGLAKNCFGGACSTSTPPSVK
jgi:hypothetical protein